MDHHKQLIGLHLFIFGNRYLSPLRGGRATCRGSKRKEGKLGINKVTSIVWGIRDSAVGELEEVQRTDPTAPFSFWLVGEGEGRGEPEDMNQHKRRRKEDIQEKKQNNPEY